MSGEMQETELGLLPLDWKLQPLGELLYIKGRIGWKGLKKSEYLDEGYAIINGEQIKNDKINWNTVGRISEERYLESPEIMLKENDILMTKDGTIGKIAFVNSLPEKATVASGVFVIRQDSNLLNQKYLFNYFKSRYFKWLIKGRIEGSVIPHLYQRDFVEMKIPLPSLPEQKAIANILTAFDDKIENLQAQNKTLEQTAQTIFKEWFGKYQVGDELPEGWSFKKIRTISNLKSGYAFKSKDFVEESTFKALKIKDLKGNGNVSLNEVSSINEECTKTERVNFFRLKRGDIVLAMSGNTTGKIGIVPPHNQELYLNQRVGKFFTKNEALNSYLYNFLMAGGFEDKILSMGYGSAQPNISPSQIEDIDIILPSNNMLAHYLKISDSIFEKVLSNKEQIQTLKKTRDTLLPKLMSGQIRVKI